MKPVTTEEALQYEIEALQAGIEKRKKNIKVFEEAIANENAEIQRELQMIAILEIHERAKHEPKRQTG